MLQRLGIIVFILLFSLGVNAQHRVGRKDTTTISYNGYRFLIRDLNHVQESSIKKNWYFGAQVGAVYSWGTHTGRLPFTGHLNPAIGVSIGKEITPISELRIQLMYQRNTGYWYGQDMTGGAELDTKYHFSSTSLNIHYMPNLTNIFFGHKERRPYNVKAIIGMGFESSFGYDGGINYSERTALPGENLVVLEFGLGVAFRLNDALKLTINATQNMIDDAFDKNTTMGRNKWDGHVNVMTGITWHFNRKVEDRHFQFVVNDETKDRAMIAETAKQKKIADDAAKNAHRYVYYDTVQVKKNVIYTLIAFDENSDDIDQLQQANIYTSARILDRYPDSHIYITNRSKRDDRLYQKRAKAIKRLLEERYDVDPRNVSYVVDENEALSEPLPTDTYIIFIIND